MKLKKWIQVLGSVSVIFGSQLHAATKIGVLLKSRNVPFWNAVEKGAVAAGKKLGADIAVKAPMNEGDVSIQIRLLNGMVDQGAQAIVIAPANEEALSGPVAAAAAKGIKIIVIDTALTGNSALTYVGTDQVAAGTAAGTLLGKLVIFSDEVALFRYSQANGSAIERETGVIAGFRAVQPKAVIHSEIYSSSVPGQEKQQAEFLLTQHRDIRAVVASGSLGTIAMLHALEEKKLSGTIKLVGFGIDLTNEAVAAIESGALSAYVVQAPQDIGAKAVEAAIKSLSGEVLPPTIYTPFTVITRDNVRDPSVQAMLAQ